MTNKLVEVMYDLIPDSIDFSYWEPGCGHIYNLKTRRFPEGKPLKFKYPDGRRGIIIPNYFPNPVNCNLVVSETLWNT